MSASLRRFFVLLFVLLQGLAPLLHAHAAGHGHGGLHLPAWDGAPGEAKPGVGWIETLDMPDSIGVASGLETRQDRQCGEPGVCLAPPRRPAAVDRSATTNLAQHRVIPARPPRLLPPACAPPA